MKTTQIIDQLNEAISLEFGAFHMYLQFALLVHGRDRLKWHEYFEAKSQESLRHARLFGDKVVALGGIPATKDAAFKQSQDLGEMLQIALEVERRAVEVYSSIHEAVQGQDKPLQFLLEQQILEEQQDVEEVERLLRQEKLEPVRIIKAA